MTKEYDNAAGPFLSAPIPHNYRYEHDRNGHALKQSAGEARCPARAGPNKLQVTTTCYLYTCLYGYISTEGRGPGRES